VIVVDTSALMAILLGESEAEGCADALTGDDEVLISAGTLAEALIVASSRGLGDGMRRLMDAAAVRVISVTEADARAVAEAYEKWGKGIHPARLNFGDCFAYVLAIRSHCSLLFVGDDFTRTDIVAAKR